MLLLRPSIWAVVITSAVAGGPPAASVPVPLGTHVQLFVDDALIASKEGVVRKAHACRKLPRPVIEPDRPWEGQRVYVYGTVIRDPVSDGFRMWYMSRNQKQPAGDPRLKYAQVDFVLYATSRDGVHWTRPDLGLYDYAGSSDNNIVFGMHSPSIVFDPVDPDRGRRYKMLGYGRMQSTRGYCAAISLDGLHWEGVEGNPVVTSGDTITLARDPKSGEYLAYHKRPGKERGYDRRMVYLATSRDFQSWSEPRRVLAPDVEDDQWATEPGQRTEFYNASIFPYAGQFLGLVTVFRKTRRLEKTAPGQSPDDGPIDVQLVHSRDGRCWSRLGDRSPVIPNGPHAYDAGCILGVSNTPVFQGDEMVFYYTAITTTHGGALPEKKITIARASWPRDRLVSLDAAGKGMVQTVALRPSGERLHVNAAAEGSLVVEVLDADGQVLSGYSAEECLPLEADRLDHVVRWKAREQLPVDQPIRLRFRLERASLYAYAIGSG